MRVLVISDSHGKKLKNILEELKPGWLFMTLPIGGKTSEIRQNYLNHQVSITHFRPDVIVLHAGHNDLMAHPVHNKSPTFIKQYFPHLLAFVALVRGHFPTSNFYLSGLFPRKSSRRMTSDEALKYNKLARRFNEMVRSASKSIGFRRLLNCFLWGSVRQAIVDPQFLDEDGLHLNAVGRKALCVDWLKQFVND
jgi:lysophospholipase L1-like esterase